MVLITKIGTDYLLSEERGIALVKFLKTNPMPSKVIDIYEDQTAMVPVSAIQEIMPDERFDEYQHKEKGDWFCKYDYWHAKGEGCAHAPKQIIEPPVDTQEMLAKAELAADPKSIRGRWIRVLKLNAGRIRKKKFGERIGLLKNLNDLAQYEATGEWPAYVDPRDWPSPGQAALL